MINKREILIEWGDCDPGGIVYYPRYFEYCDACTNALFAKAGFPKYEMVRNYDIAGIPIVESSARFFIPSQFGDVVTIESSIAEWGRSSFTVQHRIFKGPANTADGSAELAAEITEKRVWAKQIPNAKDEAAKSADGSPASAARPRRREETLAPTSPIRYKGEPIPAAVKQKLSG